MNRTDRFDVLFEPVTIGPVTAPNRFYQVPHCNGMGRHYPSGMAAMRQVKAEGGWGVVTTEQCDIHYSGNHQREIRLWDEQDLPYLERAVGLIHEHGALAGIELAHNGAHVSNLESRVPAIAPSPMPTRGLFPGMAREMDKADIRSLRRWHRNAVINARRAGFDIVYIYAGHGMTLPVNFISRRYNRRTDEYGGSLDNRTRLLRELIEDAHEASDGACAVAVRFGVDELLGPKGITAESEGREVVELLAELPDLWDVNLSDFDNDGPTARFSEENYQLDYVKFVKSVTSRPVVGVGRFTSPDVMASMVENGVLDFVGAARPSIADPFLPRKIAERRFDDIRECIGCNICVAWDRGGAPFRCTQNPTVGEEWRRDWHPERIPRAVEREAVLVVGAGPAGLEAARGLAQAGHQVTLAEQGDELGGRALRESRLPGLATYARVSDWRVRQLRKTEGVDISVGHAVTVDDVITTECSIIAVATGSSWSQGIVGRHHKEEPAGWGSLPVYTPDDIMDGNIPEGRVLILDDDHYYMAGVIAELLCAKGREISYVTAESVVAAFTQFTAEQKRIQRRVMEISAQVHTLSGVVAVSDRGLTLACVYTGRETQLRADAVVTVTGATPNDDLYRELAALPTERFAAGDRQRVVRVGDCLAPGIIADAVYSGHLFARTLDTGLTDHVPFRRENVELGWDLPLPPPNMEIEP